MSPLKKNLLVLGGGAQGRVIGADLARSLPDCLIHVADVRPPILPPLSNLKWLEADLSSAETVARLLHEHDLGVGALPSRFGLATMQAAIDARRDLVDVSFSAENPLTLDAEAARAGIAIIPDCGLAPGISNLLCGQAYAHEKPDELVIYVGGVAEDRARPYGYVVTWSLDDLLEEYTRPARIVSGGAQTTVPVFSGMETLVVEGVGELEAFYSDGLRTLMDTLPGVPEMGEKTLRWPGHAEALQPLLREGRFLEEFRARCVVAEPRDLVVLRVVVRKGSQQHVAEMVNRHDPASGLTAMARTTALTTSVTTQLVARGGVQQKGVLPLERVAPERGAPEFILEQLAARGVRPRWIS